MDEQEPLLVESASSRKLKAHEISMIAIGGTIGTGLFLGAGSSIAIAGPVGSLLAYMIISIMVYFVTNSLGEMASFNPIKGSFTTFAGLYVDPALSYALGWNYWLQWAVSLPSELSAAGIIMSFWAPNIPTWFWSAIILVCLTMVHLNGVGLFGRVEYWLSFVKVIAIVLFILAGFMIDVGLFSEPLGFQYWRIEGSPFKNGFLGIIKVFLMAFFSFGGTELVGVAAAETENPKENLPKAVKNTFYRILLFYILSIFIMGLVIRNDDPLLLDSAQKQDVVLSPFTLVFQRAGLSMASHIMNLVVLFAVLSAANSAMYASSRTLAALGEQGKAFRILGTYKNGVPIYALLVTIGFGCIAFLSILFDNGLIFMWLLNLTGISGLLTWMSISITHLRFRWALQKQQVATESLPFISPLFPFGPWISLSLGLLILSSQFIVIGFETNGFNLSGPLIGLPIFIIIFLGYKLWYKTKLVPLADVLFS